MDLFTDLQVDEGYKGISEPVRTAHAKDIIEDDGIVDIKAQRLAFLRADEHGRIDLHLVHSVERKDHTAADKVITRFADLACQCFEGINQFVIEDEWHGNADEIIVFVVVESGAKFGLNSLVRS